MYLTAVHVVRPGPGAQADGINAFHYTHGDPDWLVPPDSVPDEDPGELVNEQEEVPAGGNRVRSFLDIIAPDGATWPEIRGSFLTFVLDSESQPFPWIRLVGRCRFRVGMDDGLAPRWRSELGALYTAARQVRP